MTECPDCVAAHERAWHAFTAGCMVCSARRISRGPACHAAERAGYITPAYREELQAAAGTHWQTLHSLVLAWKRGAGIPHWPHAKTIEGA
ncbi:MAG TPA: hypothetical protein VJO99_09290 [Burkholderiaceae bacterium]|nr:hypothetical protein [Burkholderiaceae bacterium]